MMGRVIGVSFPLLFLALIEAFILKQFNSSFGWIHGVTLSYIVIAAGGYTGFLLGFRYWRISPLRRSAIVNFMIGFGFAAITMKLVLCLFFAVLGILIFIASIFTTITISSFLILAIYIGSLIPLFAMIYGILWGKYRFKVETANLDFVDLPTAFDGFRIVQISDAHSGTWDSVKSVDKGIKIIEALCPDMIVFTGDLVNGHKDEVDPFIPLFERLKCPYGKYAILGNHDYYGQPRQQEKRGAYYDDFFNKYKRMDFDLLLNESRAIEKDGHIIRLVGVENWGSGRFFPKRGDLDLATKECNPKDFTILLSHDPSHWDIKARSHRQHFHLTLSGHTHGMQFGINLPFFKWSPVQYRYKQWMGLYKEADQYLYVNRGFGLLAYPGRVGMSPEVSLIKLHKKSM